MATKLALQLSVDDISPADIASLLAAVSRIPDPRLHLVVPCLSASQAGQVRRRVREYLQADGVDPDELGLRDAEKAPFVELILPEVHIDQENEEEPIQLVPTFVSRTGQGQETPRPHIHAGPPQTNGAALNGLPQGDFRVKLVGVTKEERAGKFFVNIKLLVAEGNDAGRTMDDRVIIWPATPRTQHLARALGVAPATLSESIDRLVGKEFWNRRRETVRPDGSSQIANYYYGTEAPPPSGWVGSTTVG